MRFYIPGVSRKEAPVIGQRVMQRVAGQLPVTCPHKRLDTLDLRVSIPRGTPVTEMEKIIAEAIIHGLK